jgi:hydroxyacylglutathione hydrolase
MNILRIPIFTDNYVFVLHDPEQNVAAVVDPGVAEPVLDCLRDLSAQLVTIFNTHHDHDHVNGIPKLLQHFPDTVVYAGEKNQGRIPGNGHPVYLKAGDQVSFAGRTAEVLFLPGHTRAHIAYYFAAMGADVGELFCGDVLFAGGCGRLKESGPEQMFTSLNQLKMLPETTRVWCAHEYTLANLQFALTVDPDNLELQQRFLEVKAARERGEATIPTSIGLEKRTNPFLRSDHHHLQAAVNSTDPLQTFTRLRGKKDLFNVTSSSYAP